MGITIAMRLRAILPGQQRADRGTLLKASVTPLASIFGSGFLIVVPVLEGSFGLAALPAMAIVCVVAYLVGTAVRHNISHDGDKPSGRLVPWSSASIAVAYTISVGLYLQIMATYALDSAGGSIDPRVVSSATVVLIVFVGIVRGFSGLELVERIALAVTAVMIIVMIAVFAVKLAAAGGAPVAWSDATSQSPLHAARLLGGVLICVQGFETTRFLSERYSCDARVRASRWAQLISSVVYLAFVLVCAPLLATNVQGAPAEDGLLQLAHAIVPWLVLPIVVTAVFSQLSAAVADLETAVGNVTELSHERVRSLVSYLVLGALAIAVVWIFSTLALVAVASRAFAAFYLLQCVRAAASARGIARTAGYCMLAAAMLFVLLLASPVG